MNRHGFNVMAAVLAFAALVPVSLRAGGRSMERGKPPGMTEFGSRSGANRPPN